MALKPKAPARVATALQALESRFAAARRLAEDAAAQVAQASNRQLTQLLKAKPELRFAALAETNSVLTPEDRAKLLHSLQGQSAVSRPISASTASRWAIWRSRLPYRVVPLSLRGLSAAACIGLGLLAWHRTPESWVTFVGRQAVWSSWRLPDGSSIDRVLDPGQRYALVRWEGEMGLLRSWLPGRGYAETRVARGSLQDVR